MKERTGAIGFSTFLGGLVIGLIAGPLVAVWLGWMSYGGIGGAGEMASQGSTQTNLREALVNVQASLCAVRARTEVQDTARLDYNERWKLADKWAVMSGEMQGPAELEVKHACAEMLAQAPPRPEGTPRPSARRPS